MSFSTLFSIGSLLKVFLSLSTNKGKAKGVGGFISFKIIFKFFNLINEIKTPTPFAFPLLVERLKNTLSNEPIEKRVEKLIKKYSD